MRVITAGAVTTPVINIRIVSSGCAGRICALRCVIVRQVAMGRGSSRSPRVQAAAATAGGCGSEGDFGSTKRRG